MVRQQFGLGSYGLGEALTQRLSGLLMEVLPGAMEQRLVGDLLDERMLEGVSDSWEMGYFVKELSGLQGREAVLERLLGQRRNGMQERYRHIFPDNRGGLQELLVGGGSRSMRAARTAWMVSGTASAAWWLRLDGTPSELLKKKGLPAAFVMISFRRASGSGAVCTTDCMTTRLSRVSSAAGPVASHRTCPARAGDIRGGRWRAAKRAAPASRSTKAANHSADVASIHWQFSTARISGWP